MWRICLEAVTETGEKAWSVHLRIATVSFATFSFDQKISAQLYTWTCQPPAEICLHLGVPANSSYPECPSPWDLRRECKETIAFLMVCRSSLNIPTFPKSTNQSQMQPQCFWCNCSCQVSIVIPQLLNLTPFVLLILKMD